ncbi:MAG: CehA/McbA family metallohydrolase [Planctomycetota bacterium]
MPALCTCCLLMLAATTAWADEATSKRRVIEPRLLHLRSGVEREWSEFPETPHGQRLDATFDSTKNTTEQTLLVRQQDVKQVWNVLLNGKKLGALTIDENDMVVTFAIPAGGLVEGDNSLRIESPPASKAASDDIRVGQIAVVNRSVREALRGATLDVEVVDADSKQPLPCRITVLDSNGAMQTLGAESNDHLAVRPGMAFTSTGRASLGVPAGQYTIFAGRGFEYSIAQTEVTVGAGETAKKTLAIRREVPTEGYVACDTHVHTLTHSGHGDATSDERMITLAGEGIELPIATDHNKHIDYEEAAAKQGVRRYFTPVMGNEVTTPRGHFNIFPIAAGSRVVDHKLTDWKLLFDDIQQTPGVKVAILNHARDLHSGVRPFGPVHHNALVGENLDDWPLRFNAMEVINSGATQTDPLRLFHDWMGLLNRGLNVTPVGSSDSHDVGRHFVGQGRTYIRCDDRDPGKLNVEEAVSNFVQGRVMVSYGLLTEITVNEKHHSGATVATGEDEVKIDVRVLGPHWSRASQVQLFANGRVIGSSKIPESPDASLPVGVKWVGHWMTPKFQHDVHLVAIATGPGIDGLHWRTAKPYQPTSPDWEARTIGCSGAVWLDVDGDGRLSSARAYAERLVAAADNDWKKLIASLWDYDDAVAAQAAHLVRVSGTSLQSEPLRSALKGGREMTQSGFRAYAEAWRENEIARAKP